MVSSNLIELDVVVMDWLFQDSFGSMEGCTSGDYKGKSKWQWT